MRSVNSEPSLEGCVQAAEMLIKAINEMSERFAEAVEKTTRLMKLQAEKGVRVVSKEKLHRDSIWFRMRIRLKLFSILRFAGSCMSFGSGFACGLSRKPTVIAAVLSASILTTAGGRSSRTPTYKPHTII